jgi:hypothetical protein
MNLEQNLRRAFAPREPMPEFEDAVMARVSIAAQRPVRRLGRPILYGTILVVTAAAAMLAASLMDRSVIHSEAAVLQQEPIGGAGTLSPRLISPAAELSQNVPAPKEMVPPVDDTASTQLQNQAKSALITVRVALSDPPTKQGPMRAALEDPAVQEILQSLRAALVVELRKVPGVTVLDKDPTEITPASRHYRLRIAPYLVTELDGRLERYEHGYPVGLTAQELQSGGTSIQRPHTLFVLVGVDSIATCRSVAPAVDLPCPPVPEAAAELVHKLRQEVFPPDAYVTRPLQAGIGDSLLAPEERFKSFAELFKQQAKSEGKGLLSDKGVVRAAVELAQLVDPVRRAQVWRAMRGVGDALLVEPLLASLQLDPEVVRIAAIETLTDDFSGDRRVRSALEAAAIADPRPLVRAVAQRGLSGEEGWRTYVASSLKNASLPDSQRVEALMYELYPPQTIEGASVPSPANYWQILKELDGPAVRALVEIFPRADVFRSGPSNNLLGNFAVTHNQNPAVTELLLHVLAHDSKAMNREVAGKVLIETHRWDGFRNESRVLEALTKAISSDPDPEVRDDIRQMMERKYE